MVCGVSITLRDGWCSLGEKVGGAAAVVRMCCSTFPNARFERGVRRAVHMCWDCQDGIA